MHSEKTRHNNQRGKKYFLSPFLNVLNESFTNMRNVGSSESKEDDEEKTALIHRLFYAELMKLFIIESGKVKSSKVNETELDQKILVTANDYHAFYSDLYIVSSFNQYYN
jgi:hypothetical protein